MVFPPVLSTCNSLNLFSHGNHMLRGFGAYFFPIRHTALLYYADFSMSTSFVHFLGFSMDFVQFLQFLCRYRTDFIFLFTEFMPKSTFLSRISLKHSSLTFFHMPACDIIFLRMFLSYMHPVFFRYKTGIVEDF